MIHHGDFSVSGQEANGGYNFGGILSTSNKNHRIHILGSHAEGDDTEFDGGTIEGTDYATVIKKTIMNSCWIFVEPIRTTLVHLYYR